MEKLTLMTRLKNSWNAFRNRDPTMLYNELGMSYTYRPDRVRFSRGNERSIVTSIYNKRAPSGRVVSFVAKLGEISVFMALSNSGYDPNQYKQGVYSSGRIAYKKDHASKINI